jgi:DNA-binding NarL/FixJ family response regulator
VSVRVLVVDDHPMFRRGLAGLLESLPDVELAGLAGSGEEALELAGADRPDVVLMDLNLPTISGVEATRRLGGLPEPPAVLALTMLDDDATVVAAMRAGARGYVLKGASGEEIAAAVRTVAAGGVVLGAGVAGHLLALSDAGRHRAPDALTDRERDVLELLADGLANPQIARRLGLSVKTVQNYVSRILDKLQVADRTQAALRARDHRSGESVAGS